MSTYTNFAIIGAGNVGKFIIDEFLKLKADGAVSSVTLVTRSDTRDLDWESKGLKYATINYDEPSTLVDAFRGVEVVISTVAYRAVDQQRQLAQAAKEAGVKTFAPSEYGGETHRVTDHALFLTKKRIHEYLEEIKLPYTLFYTGPTPDFFLSPLFGWDFAGGKATYGASGKPITFTARPDVARFVAYAFTRLPTSRLEWGTFRLEGERTTFDEVVKTYESKTGKMLDVTRLSSEELEEREKAGDFLGILYNKYEKGYGVVGEPDNDLYPGWNPKKVADFI